MLFKFWGLEFNSYPTCLAIAFLFCVLGVVRQAERLDKPVLITPLGGLWAFVGALLGAKIWWILQYRDGWDKITQLYRAFFIWEGGLVFFGGLLGGITLAVAYLTINKFDKWRVADCVAPYVALGEAIVRVGCFLNGCCWGCAFPQDAPWPLKFLAVTYPKSSLAYARQIKDGLIERGAALPLPVHPAPLYMIFGLLIAFVILHWGIGHRAFPGANGLLYVFLYGIVRFTVEAFRWRYGHGGVPIGGDSLPSFHGMTISQTFSLLMMIGSATTFFIIYSGAIGVKRVAAEAEGPPVEAVACEAEPVKEANPATMKEEDGTRSSDSPFQPENPFEL